MAEAAPSLFRMNRLTFGRSTSGVVGFPALFSLLLLLGLSTAPARAGNFNVGTDGALRAALNPISGAQNGDTVTFTGNITLSADLPAVQNSITIEGNGLILDGNLQFRGFFVGAFASGTAIPIGVNVAIRDLTIQHALAKGGDSGYGGAGAGFGGSIFVANLANVTLFNVILSDNGATGGSAGRDSPAAGSYIAGGGGMGGDGYSGGGGVGAGSEGAYSGIASDLPNPFDAAPGIFIGAASGGNGSFTAGLGYGAGAAAGGGGGGGGGRRGRHGCRFGRKRGLWGRRWQCRDYICQQRKRWLRRGSRRRMERRGQWRLRRRRWRAQ